MDKQQIRSSIKAKRLALVQRERSALAKQMSRHVLNSLWFLRSHLLAFYLPIKGEIATHFIMQQALAMRKQCYLPVLHPLQYERLYFVRYRSPHELNINHYGILEPALTTTQRIQPWALDVVFLPLVAFDHQHNRLGMGKGYYDRTLAGIKNFPQRQRPLLIGLAYEFQRVDTLPIEKWDIPLDYIVTEKKIY